MQKKSWTVILPLIVAVLVQSATNAQNAAAIDERPGTEGEWGFRPREGEGSAVDPVAFAWRPQKGATVYELEVARDAAFATLEYEARAIGFSVHCPTRALGEGLHAWRFRFVDASGALSAWSRTRTFTIDRGAVSLPLPSRAELLSRIPREHPRLFLRPEDLDRLRVLARTDLRAAYEALRRRSENLLAKPPSTDEPPLYGVDAPYKSERWREIWWGNRTATIAVLDSAATLAFTWRIDGDERFANEAQRLLMAAARWDPKGATGYRYNDEAGMPYAYHFSRTYTFLWQHLNEEERAKCREVMRVRGAEMAKHLIPNHLWKPYSSHSNRAWHFLGEVGIAFLGELPDAERWVWFALNVFRCTYPVWSDEDGGWHEGMAYWRSYLGRFTWWADVMKAATGIDAYRKPFFASVGNWALYVQPPGSKVGGFGDLAFLTSADRSAELMRVFASQAANPYWQSYLEAVEPTWKPSTYIDFLRGALPAIAPKPLDDLPTSRVFHGIGQAALNTNLRDGRENVGVLFKASPFGTQSHGYEGQNAFVLTAFGEPLLIRTGKRDLYGSDHHKNWMWETKSVNSLLVDGKGQIPHSSKAKARITAERLGGSIELVEGEAGEAYGGRLERFTRTIVFVKPEWIVVLDDVAAVKPATFQWLLHAPTEMTIADGSQVLVENGKAACRVSFLEPAGLRLTQTDRFDPPPRERVKLVQYHLTAETPAPSQQQRFVVAIQPFHANARPLPAPMIERTNEGLGVRLETPHGDVLVLWSAKADGGGFDWMDHQASTTFTILRRDTHGKVLEHVTR